MKEKEYFGFIWDEEKAIKNKEKHGVSFEVATRIFNDPFLFETFDSNHSIYEDRYIYIGSVMESLLLFVIATDRDNKIRIISARKANTEERKLYYENIKNLQAY